MATTGDVGAGDKAQHRCIIAHDPRSKALAQIGIEVDAHHTVTFLVGRLLASAMSRPRPLRCHNR